MKVLVGVKRVIDFNVKIRVKADNSGVETNNVRTSINPFDEIAVEEAIRMKEKGIVDEVIAVSVGDIKSKETILHSLALGADRGLLIETDENIRPLGIAKILKQVVEKEQVEIVLLGKQAIDDDSNQTGQMLAALLNWSQGTFASKIEIDGNTITLDREVDSGKETIKIELPTVITTDLRLNEPRFAKLPNIIKSKKKPLDTIKVAELDIDVSSKLKTIKITPPSERNPGIIVSGVDELIDKLKNEVKII